MFVELVNRVSDEQRKRFAATDVSGWSLGSAVSWTSESINLGRHLGLQNIKWETWESNLFVASGTPILKKWNLNREQLTSSYKRRKLSMEYLWGNGGNAGFLLATVFSTYLLPSSLAAEVICGVIKRGLMMWKKDEADSSWHYYNRQITRLTPQIRSAWVDLSSGL